MRSDAELKREAAERGLAWSDVLDAYSELREQEAAQLETVRHLRRLVFEAYAKPGEKWTQAASRFKATYRRQLTLGDASMIPGLDVLAADIQSAYGCLGDDPTRALYDLVAQPYPASSGRADVIRQAMDFIEEYYSVPF